MDTKNVTLATTCRVLEDLFCNPLDLVNGKGVLMHQFATEAFPPFTFFGPVHLIAKKKRRTMQNGCMGH